MSGTNWKTESKTDYNPFTNVKSLNLSSVSSQIHASPLRENNSSIKPFQGSHSRSISSTSAGSSQKQPPIEFQKTPKIMVIDENGRSLQNIPGLEGNKIRMSMINLFDKEMDDFRRKMNVEDADYITGDKHFQRPLEERFSPHESRQYTASFVNSTLREEEESIHLRVENERMKSELKFLKNKLEERDKEIQRQKILNDQNLEVLAKANDQLNILLKDRAREIDELRLSKWKGIDRKEYEDYFKIKMDKLEHRCVQLQQELNYSKAKYEALESDKIRLETMHGVKTTNTQWEAIIKEKVKLIDELQKKNWELERNKPQKVIDVRLLEMFLLVSIEVERLHAILKGRLEEIRLLRNKIGDVKDGRPTVKNSSPIRKENI